MNAASSNPHDPDYLTLADNVRIAYHRLPGRQPGIIFLGGFMSDMTGTKALALEDFARTSGQAFLRFDYQGHGASSGQFQAGTIGQWRDDAIAVIDALSDGPQILVGSSMGGWIMLLAALARPQRVAGLLGIAAAPDFTEDLMWPAFSEEIQQTLARDGVYFAPSEYGDAAYPITMNLIADGRTHLLLRSPLNIQAPVRLLQGMCDPDVPYQHADKIVDALATGDVELTLIKDGDHRLSRDRDLALLRRTLAGLVAMVEGDEKP